MHYAGEDRVYLLFKNRFTGEWEFPTSKIFLGKSFFKAKMEFFSTLTDDKWKIKMFKPLPAITTLRDFTNEETTDPRNADFKGVRTMYFNMHHWRGYPEMALDNTEYIDHVWVPKN